FNFALKEAVEDLGIKYYALPQRLEISHRDLIDAPSLNSRVDQVTFSPQRNYSEDISRLHRRKTSRPEGE
ncbi:hypothetical protein BGZ65_011660, partial [Modicella reniformis]